MSPTDATRVIVFDTTLRDGEQAAVALLIDIKAMDLPSPYSRPVRAVDGRRKRYRHLRRENGRSADIF